ncbi:Nlp family transcriptional regulator [Vibrio parahaemolyticus]|uniref:helix-turn-helix domain-containing protein n=1 Tax=Vibrio parahaemolyticus TaxID=670 RepID=UPI001122CE73|nr:helix-turn-helix domain-containing protein [Vibrio parahaemolyticus]MBE3834285.1 transcriptional regulator [Vibrio parahaemolyticus]MCZ6289031.1 helix-turn-helix domain-containing protein [Vibrio parahaemolyticus]TOR12782.1 Nlp family transcriptional regulator [Vibrio parahaemolyticus]UJW91804.1 helix-turn-helix domain-containing protein [Vibrio parahaemolyticus]UJX06036.1 helix-turn-helix domain-containing protein [Vibrio parahaemolyticus]
MSQNADPLFLAVVAALGGKEDVPRHYIAAGLRDHGWSVAVLSKVKGVELKNALDRPWPKGEKIIAEALGVEPEHIWPVRYRERAKMVRVA